jgi:hypothetical protein
MVRLAVPGAPGWTITALLRLHELTSNKATRTKTEQTKFFTVKKSYTNSLPGTGLLKKVSVERNPLLREEGVSAPKRNGPVP